MSNGIGIDEQSAVRIEGASDGTEIGNVNDRLKVDASFSPSVAPADKVVYQRLFLENTGSNNMAVNGSVTPVVFEYGPPANETWYIDELSFVIDDAGNNTLSYFGAINGGLSNGVLIEQVITSTNYTIVNLKNNLEVVTYFSDHSFRGLANAYLNSVTFYTGKAELRVPITLSGANGDKIQATVRDDLTGVDDLKVGIEYFKII